MGLLEPITHQEEIESLINSAENMYEDATKRLDKQKSKTAKSLEELGELKLNIWSNEIREFTNVFSSYNNAVYLANPNHSYNLADISIPPQQIFLNMQSGSITATEIIGAGTIGLGVGALIGVASYGGVMMFGHASTGRAISALAGAAKANATLAWFGGGSLATGGLGKLGGKLVLGGIVVAPLLLVAGAITASKSQKKLEEARRIHNQAKDAVDQIDKVIDSLKSIQRISDEYYGFLNNMSLLFEPFVSDMKRIAEEYPKGQNNKINYDDLSEMDRKTVDLSWSLAQLYYHGLSAPIIDDDGNVASNAKYILEHNKREYYAIRADVSSLNSEKSEISKLLSETKNIFEDARKMFFDKKNQAQKDLINLGYKKIEWCAKGLLTYVNRISSIDEIPFENKLHFDGLKQNNYVAFQSLIDATNVAEYINTSDTNSIPLSTVLEIASFNAIKLLSNVRENKNDIFLNNGIAKHNISLWLAEELPAFEQKEFIYCGMSLAKINAAAKTVSSITGKENLSQAKSIKNKVATFVDSLNNARHSFEKISKETESCIKIYEKVEKMLRAFEDEVNSICSNHYENINSLIPFIDLDNSEKEVVQLSWNIAMLNYNLLSSSIILKNENADCSIMNMTINQVSNEIKLLHKETFNYSGEKTRAADVIWKPYADKIQYVNFGTMALLIVSGFFQIFSGDWFGLLPLFSSIIALPKFFYYKNLSQSQLFLWRTIRLIAAFVIAFGVQHLF